jgi:hypothetical protein
MNIKKFTMQDAIALGKLIQANQAQIKAVGGEATKHVAQLAVSKLTPEQLTSLKDHVDKFDPQDFSQNMRPDLEKKVGKDTVDLLEQVLKGDFSKVLDKVESLQERIGNVAQAITKNFGQSAGETFGHYAELVTSGLLTAAMNAQGIFPKLLEQVPEGTQALNDKMQKDLDAQEVKIKTSKELTDKGAAKLAEVSRLLHEKLYGGKAEKPESLADVFTNAFGELKTVLDADKAKTDAPAAGGETTTPPVENQNKEEGPKS